VWNRQRRDEVLIDVDDVALSHETRMRWNAADDWIWSSEQTHEALIDRETFRAAQARLTGGVATRAERGPRPTSRTYQLTGLVHCGLCGRRMEGSWNHGRPHCRCRRGRADAGATHPAAAYLREDLVTTRLDQWICQVFDPANMDTTVDALTEAASQSSPGEEASPTAARATLQSCDDRLAKYRAALEADADAATVAA
jgi:site-specific DNA recombinase